MIWNFDISQAPRGNTVSFTFETAKGPREVSRFIPERVILATKCDKVTLSKFIPDENRWEMLGKGEEPVAWMPWPTHPHSLRPSPRPQRKAGANLPPVSPATPSVGAS
jgi:hypothetical protein